MIDHTTLRIVAALALTVASACAAEVDDTEAPDAAGGGAGGGASPPPSREAGAPPTNDAAGDAGGAGDAGAAGGADSAAAGGADDADLLRFADVPPPPDAMVMPDTGPLPPPLEPLPEMRRIDSRQFTTADICAQCHANSDEARAMRDADGAPVAPYDLWRSSVMANAARDPIWRAVVSAELLATPSLRPIIEERCLHCHAPMADYELIGEEGEPTLSMLDDGTDRGLLGLEGVSCTLCHQIEPEGLGEPESWTGNFVVGSSRRIYGPHEDLEAEAMRARTGFGLATGDHLRQSNLCATCHTLFTSAFDAAGNPVGVQFPEQTPYLEWRNSDYYAGSPGAGGTDPTGCQGCHMPPIDDQGRPIRTAVARTPPGADYDDIQTRTPYARHVFIGGNTLLLSMLRDQAEHLRPVAPPEAFDHTIALIRDQLRNRTATLEIGEIDREGERLQIPVHVENLSGHKFPTGYPSRRAWLKVTVRNGRWATVFRSGHYDARGRIVGPDRRPLTFESVGGLIAPHRERIDRPDDVQIYESLMEGTDRRPTITLLRATGYLKDNRLLPRGWRADHADAAATAPVGIDGDSNFVGGGDDIVYVVDAPAAEGPYEVRVEMVFQVVSARFANELLAVDTPEIRAFERYYRLADVRPEPVAEAVAIAR